MMSLRVGNTTQHHHHPTPPPPSHAPSSMVKLNVDATIAGNIIAFAVVARDSYGEVFRV